MKSSIFLLPLVAVLLSSCKIEQNTPPAPLQPAPYYAPSVATAIAPPAPLSTEPRAAETIFKDGQVLAAAQAQGTPSTRSQMPVTSADTSHYTQNYKAVGKPRITLFYNRKISDPVNEWPSSLTERSGFRHHFENQMNRALIQAKTRVVDFDTVLQLAAVDSGKTMKDLEDELASKRIEITALREYTDLFIEIHCQIDANAPSGYLFRAVAKEVQTGQIIADTLCNNFGAGKIYVEAGEAGYAVKQTLPDLDQTANYLNEYLMADLSAAWE